jgi:hypothetical protein
MADLPELDLSPLREVATERLHNALAKINGTDGVELKQGLDELTALTKRSDDTSDALDVVLQTGLLRRLLAFLQPDFLTQFPGQQVPVKGVSAEPLLLPLGEAVQIATLAALSECLAAQMDMGARGMTCLSFLAEHHWPAADEAVGFSRGWKCKHGSKQ